MYVCSGHICSTCIVWVHNEKQNKSLTFICQVHEKNKTNEGKVFYEDVDRPGVTSWELPQGGKLVSGRGKKSKRLKKSSSHGESGGSTGRIAVREVHVGIKKSSAAKTTAKTDTTDTYHVDPSTGRQYSYNATSGKKAGLDSDGSSRKIRVREVHVGMKKSSNRYDEQEKGSESTSGQNRVGTKEFRRKQLLKSNTVDDRVL